MNCPDGHGPLRQTDYRAVQIHECATCLGRWFDRDELRLAKDRTDEDLRWLDFDPFLQEAEAATPSSRSCPVCAAPMGSIVYESSGVLIDSCPNGHGVWLDHGEFEKIVDHLEREVASRTAAEFRKDAVHALAQTVTGKEGLVSELRDLFAVLGLLEARLGVEHPRIAAAVNAIYVGSPFK
jgi:Zn-finger nucleic acid-binding protein